MGDFYNVTKLVMLKYLDRMLSIILNKDFSACIIKKMGV